MSSDDVAIQAIGIVKAYALFEKPSHRLWQMLLRGSRRFYSEHLALKDVSFQVCRGETVGVVGKNGSGKSTLLSILCGTLSASAGTVVVNGKVAALLELGAGFNPELSGAENIVLCAQIYGLTVEQIESRREQIIAFADIGDYIVQPVKTYSSGMFTRLAFAVVAHVDADILVIDEALAVGDAYFVQKCMRFLESFKQKGGTLFFVSHDMGSVTSLCNRAIWLRDGVVVMDDSPKRVAQEYLADLYRERQGSAKPDLAPSRTPAAAVRISLDAERYDPRRGLLLNSTIRNDIEVHSFKSAHDFGSQGADIFSSALTDTEGNPVSWVVGGELVCLEVAVKARAPIASIIVGFVLKNKNGQPLFGDNTHLTTLDDPVPMCSGDEATVTFCFLMPIMPVGDYAISLAVSDGSQRDHTVLQWIHDAIIVSSHSTSLAHGLIGIPMRTIDVEVNRNPAIHDE